MDGQTLTDQGMGRSVQHEEVHAAILAIEQSHKEVYKFVRIYSDSCCCAMALQGGQKNGNIPTGR
jgi:hypothetical protein